MIGLFGRLRIGAFILFWALLMVMIPLATGKLANARFGMFFRVLPFIKDMDIIGYTYQQERTYPVLVKP